ncbi:MAG: 2OG-Fe(II) oxygenase family protein [Pseudomonadota bacterium]
MMGEPLTLNPTLDPAALAAAYASAQRLQIRDVLTQASAGAIHALLSRDTPWGLAWKGEGKPAWLRRADVAALSVEQQQAMTFELTAAMRRGDYAFLYTVYPMLTAYLEKWAPGGAFDRLFEAINGEAFLAFVRTVTGIPELIKADAQATLYAPNQFLAQHNDADHERGRRVAYVLSLCAEEWRPDWGGYLNFLDADGDVIAGYQPRFNALNLFTVPQLHNVSLVPWFAPTGRFAITGWFRDR